jgi:hypothetical protein
VDLVFIHGPAAVGKLTVARELSRITGFRLFHNHLTVDAVAAVFDFGTEPFVLLREQIWLTVFREAARRDISLIFTFTPERTVRASFVQDTLDAVASARGTVRFVRLTCPMDELERRIAHASRSQFGKLRSLELFRELSRSGAFAYPELPDSGLSIDTSRTSATEAAARIGEFFSLAPKAP